jgi:glutaconyl-CoA/methylmalonyl-CoA decarboxylase subunit delta
MDTIELLQKFADPEVMKALSLSDRLFAGLITTLLGMGITFISLVILQIVIQLTARLAAAKPEKKVSVEAEKAYSDNSAKKQMLQEEEIVAAIATALAVQLKTSVSNIVIRNIEKVGEPSSSWHKAGLAEQMNNSL